MTRNKDVKRLVRARMRQTGQPYTAARADLLRTDDAAPPPRGTSRPAPPAGSDEWRRAEAEYRTMVGRFIHDGRLTTFPARRRARQFVLLHLIALFPAGRTYTEPEVNELLCTVVEDFAVWRRELVDCGYLQRALGRYWLPREAPRREAHLRQEIPAWEAPWLPTHLRDRER